VLKQAPARALAATAGLTMSLIILGTPPAPVATAADREPIERVASEPVRWLPKPGDRNALRGQSTASELDEEVERLRRAERRRALRQAVHPVAARHNYGESQARFGVARPGHMHAGQDIFGADGAPLVAIRKSVVIETGSDGGRGNFIALHSPEADETYVYLHLQEPAEVHPGDTVGAGDRVGSMGCTGSCSGTHLHFEVRAGKSLSGEAHDPLPLLKQWEAS